MDKLTSSQLSEWEAYDRLDPIGEWRADFHMAKMVSVITNLFLQIYGEKGKELTSANDFMPKWHEDSIKEEDDPNAFWSLSKHGWVKHYRQTPEQMKQAALSVASMQNKKVGNKLRNIPPKTRKK